MSSKIESASVENVNSSGRMLLVPNECFSMISHELRIPHLKTVRGAFVLMTLTVPFWGLQADAQVRPDLTLKEERSIVAPIDERSDRIEGGAARGGNLFHSFQDFNVGGGRGVFFANPAGIENILSRVTGRNPSNILGELGVLGQANLWLLNPNGVVFGPNASVQVAGSFFASTADAIELGEQGSFSAVEPEQSQLLVVSPGASFFEQAVNQSGSIINQGSLLVGEQQSVGLMGDRVLHTGTITAPGGSVTLLGNQVSLEGLAAVDVSSFIAGGSVLIGGDVQGGTVANAGRTFIGPDVVIEANALTQGDGGRVVVGADEVVGFYGQVNARGGSLSGDGGFVEVSGKEHVLFRGHVDTSAVQGETGELVLDPVNITISNGLGDGAGDGTDTFSGDESGLAGAVLSQPLSAFDDAAPVTIFESELEGLAGDTNVSLQATNDIRVEDLADNELTFAAGDGSIEFVADADMDGAGAFGMEDLALDTIATNGRNVAISGATLSLGNIDTSRGASNGGDVDLDASGDIIAGRIDTNSTFNALPSSLGISETTGRGGDINISTLSGDITTNGELNASSLSYRDNSLTLKNSSRGGSISLSTISGDILTREALNSSSSASATSGYSSGRSGPGGDISLSTMSGSITTSDLNSSSSSTSSYTAGRTGSGGDISLSTMSGSITTGALISVSASAGNYFSGQSGRGGDISLSTMSGSIATEGLNSSSMSYSAEPADFSTTDDSGLGGNISLTTFSGNITTSGKLNSFSLSGQGNSGRGGDISLSTLSGEITTIEELDSSSEAVFPPDTDGDFNAAARGGNIIIRSNSGDITIRKKLSSFSRAESSFYRTEFAENGGNITISSLSGDILIDGAVDSHTTSGFKVGGDITIYSNSGNIITNADVESGFTLGGGGDITIHTNSGDIVTESQINSYSRRVFGGLGGGNGGDISVSTVSGDIVTKGVINSFGDGQYTAPNGGNISIFSDSGNITTYAEVNSYASTFNAAGSGGDILISSLSGDLKIEGNLRASASTYSGGDNDFGGVDGPGEGGDITLSSKEGSIVGRDSQTQIETFSETFTGDRGENGGQVTLESNNISGLAVVTFSDFTESGNVIIKGLQGDLFLKNVSVTTSTNTSTFGPGSDTVIIGSEDVLLENFTLQSDSNGSSEAGSVFIGTPGNLNFIDSQISINANSVGDAGNVEIGTDVALVKIIDDEAIILEEVTPERITFAGKNSGIFARSSGSGNAGSINIEASKFVTLRAGSQLTVATSDAGEAGNITVTTDKVTLGEGAQLSATATQDATNLEGGGSIVINASSLDIAGELGVFAETQGQAPAGILTLQSNANNPDLNILFTDNGLISASSTDVGLGGDINITAPQAITILGTGKIAVETSGSGDAGNINIGSSILRLEDGVDVTASTTGAGDAGNINLDANQINLQQAVVTAITSSSGNAGSITLSYQGGTSEAVTLENSIVSTVIRTPVQASTLGDIDNSLSSIRLDAKNLSLANDSLINASTLGQGNAGNIAIRNADTVTLDTSEITASSSGKGNTGLISLNASETIKLSNNSVIRSSIRKGAMGDSRRIVLNTPNLVLTAASEISATIAGEGNAGNIEVLSAETVDLDNSTISTAILKPGQAPVPSTIKLDTKKLALANGSLINASTSGEGNAGNIDVLNANTVDLDNSIISTVIREPGQAESLSSVTLDTKSLNLANDSQIDASTFGEGDAGNIVLRNAETITLDASGINASTSGAGSTGLITFNASEGINLNNSGIRSSVQRGAKGDSQRIILNTPNLFLTAESEISATTAGEGNAGNIDVLNAETVSLNKSTISTEIGEQGKAEAPSNITINTESLSLKNESAVSSESKGIGNSGSISIPTADFITFEASELTASTSGSGNTGIIDINATEEIRLSDGRILSSVEAGATGNSQKINLNTSNLSLAKKSEISATTDGKGNAGIITIANQEGNAQSVTLDGSTISTEIGEQGEAETPSNITINTENLSLKNESAVSLESKGIGNSGSIFVSSVDLIPSAGLVTLDDSILSTSATQASAGIIEVKAREIQLNNGDITTDVETGKGTGGDITLTATGFILAKGDSDILAFARQGSGGNINLNTPIFIGESFAFTPRVSDFDGLDGNGVVNVNATGDISSGTISTPDNSIIEESLTELPDNLVDTNDLLANSCIVRPESPQGNFIITGADSLRARPGYPASPAFPTGTVRTTLTDRTAAVPPDRPWQIGDPIIEPESVYRLPDGQLVISRECSE